VTFKQAMGKLKACIEKLTHEQKAAIREELIARCRKSTHD